MNINESASECKDDVEFVITDRCNCINCKWLDRGTNICDNYCIKITIPGSQLCSNFIHRESNKAIRIIKTCSDTPVVGG